MIESQNYLLESNPLKKEIIKMTKFTTENKSKKDTKNNKNIEGINRKKNTEIITEMIVTIINKIKIKTTNKTIKYGIRYFPNKNRLQNLLPKKQLKINLKITFTTQTN